MKPPLSAISTAFLAIALGTLSYAVLDKPTNPPKDLSFGRDVHPILARHCLKCHGADASKAAAGLRLDIFQGATKKLADGMVAIVPGAPDKSFLIQRIEEKEPASAMPPPGAGVPPLTSDEKSVIRAWIARGAKYEKHWAFVPPKMPTVPPVHQATWVRNPIDRFVLAKMESVGLKPEPEADRETLAVRAAQTLTGLPPTPEELDAYRKDQKPGAYERYVDRLIAKPEYGEHQARYWLDAVRYADTHGLQLDNERSIYPYRDWIIRAFNRDLPFDKFVEWQLAGDLLPNPTNEQLVATGYVRANLTSNEGGAIDEEFLARNTFDRVDTTGTVLLGMTIGCARCHDHKYDPIKQRDYYGLYAYFDSTADAPLDGNIALPPPFVATPSEGQAKRLEQIANAKADIETTVSIPSVSAWCVDNQRIPAEFKDWMRSPVYASKSFDDAFATPEPPEPGQRDHFDWRPLSYTPGTPLANIIGKDNASIYIRSIIHTAVAHSVQLKVSNDDAVRVWLNGSLIHSNKVSRGLGPGDDVRADLRAGDNEFIAKVINGAGPDGFAVRFGEDGRAVVGAAVEQYRKNPSPLTERTLIDAYLENGPINVGSERYRQLMKEEASIEAMEPKTLVAQEMQNPRPTFILRRGEYNQKGDPVNRHLPPALCDYSGAPQPGGPQNRLTLARWLVSPSNPLVARVFVNRVWQQFFGVGIVKTSEDFGTQGEWPLNQPLLDYLAVHFMQDGWSVKRLNRLIVTSAAFRQSSHISPAKLLKDPENRYVSRGPRFRLDAEVIRDKALLAGGLLRDEIGGHGFKPYQPDGLWEAASDPASQTHIYKRDHDGSIYRRSMYIFWKRTSPPPVMTTFDAPLRDTCTVRRSITNTPLQALTELNETAFLEASRTMASRLLDASNDDSRRLKLACELTLGREPDATDTAILMKALDRYRRIYSADPERAERLLAVGDAPKDKHHPAVVEAAWMIVCSTLMNTDDFLTLH